MRFLECFRDPSSVGGPGKGKDVDEPLLDAEGKKQGCIFCNVSRDKGFNVVWEDEELIAFRDRSPRAAVHLLVIPRAHTADSVRNLTSAHIPLVQRMTAKGHQLALSLTDQPKPVLKSGFHIPPFSSVPHLHLHVFVLPHTFIGRMKYPIASDGASPGYGGHQHAARAGSPISGQGAQDHAELGEHNQGSIPDARHGKKREKGWSWFVSAEQSLRILATGGTIGLGRS